MTEATKPETTEDDPLALPWFLDAKNPENIARRAERAKHRLVRPAKAPPKRVAKPAKSVATMPVSDKQTDTKPDKVINVPAPKPAPAPKKGKLSADAIIRVLVTEFGHKAGSKAETKSAALKDGMTVAEYMAVDLGYAGKWHTSHLTHCLGKNFIKLESAK